MTSNPKAKVKYRLGKDVDLSKEVIRGQDGKRITNKRAESIIEEVIATAAGRPSLTGPAVRSPEIKARVPKKLKEELEQFAIKSGQTPSALIRKALEEFLRSA